MPSGPFVHLVGPGPLLGIEIHSRTRQPVWISYSRDTESEDRVPAMYAKLTIESQPRADCVAFQ